MAQSIILVCTSTDPGGSASPLLLFPLGHYTTAVGRVSPLRSGYHPRPPIRKWKLKRENNRQCNVA